MMVQISEDKFRALSEEHQHRLCCKLLRRVFEEGDALAHQTYLHLCEWLMIESVSSDQPEAIADRFHWHLRKSGRGLKGANLLANPKQRDRQEPIAPSLPIHVYLDKIRSAHNVGSILRTVDAFQLGKVFFSQDMCSADNAQVRSTSMGTHEWVHCATMDDPARLPKPLIALETQEQAIPLYDFVFPHECTLVLGNEEIGCSKDVLKRTDATLYIPMYGRKNSLNVANAFAVVASEIRRQYDLKQRRNSSNG